MKPMFLLFQCIRLLHTDPWQSTNWQIVNIGEYSYHVISLNSSGDITFNYIDDEYISFREQKRYQDVKCPGDDE